MQIHEFAINEQTKNETPNKEQRTPNTEHRTPNTCPPTGGTNKEKQ